MTLHELRHRLHLTAQNSGIDNTTHDRGGKTMRERGGNTIRCDAIEQHNVNTK